MPKYTVLCPIGWNGRHEKGDEVEMPVEDAKAFGPKYVIEVGKEPVEEPAVAEDEKVEDDLDALEREELKELIKQDKLDVKMSGKTDAEVREEIRAVRAVAEDEK